VDLARIPACRQAGNSFSNVPLTKIINVEISGIEPELQQCECCVIPFYYIPEKILVRGKNAMYELYPPMAKLYHKPSNKNDTFYKIICPINK
jgi:hypothetical protein